jgi:hypothetical protein
MTSSPQYLIDTDVLITAKNSYYAFSVCPGFWAWLLREQGRQIVGSIDRVKSEILMGSKEDDLVRWVGSDTEEDFFQDTGGDSSVVNAYRDVMLWAQQHGQYTDSAKAKFASGADGWLVAYAMIHGSKVVTNEKPRPEAKNEIKLPDVCDAFDVRTLDTFTLLRHLKARFILDENNI